MAGRLLAEGEVVLSALATYAGPRSDTYRHASVNDMSQVPPVEAVVPMPHGPMLPAFLQHVDMRWTQGGVPWSKDPSGTSAQWVRFDEVAVSDAPVWIASADAKPPVVLADLPVGQMCATVEASFHVHHQAPLPSDAWVWLRSRRTEGAEGFVEEISEVFDASGRLLLRGRQLQALLRPPQARR